MCSVPDGETGFLGIIITAVGPVGLVPGPGEDGREADGWTPTTSSAELR
jgi:hypothetical protein